MPAVYLEFLRVDAIGAGRCLIEELGADGEGERNVLRREVAFCGVRAGGVGLGGEALLEIVTPGIEVVDPGLYGEDPGAEVIDGEGGGPEVVAERGERGGSPVVFAGVLVEQAAGDVVMAVGKDGGGDVDAVVEEAARGIPAAIDLRLDGFNDDSFAAFGRFHLVRFTVMHCDPSFMGPAGPGG